MCSLVQQTNELMLVSLLSGPLLNNLVIFQKFCTETPEKRENVQWSKVDNSSASEIAAFSLV